MQTVWPRAAAAAERLWSDEALNVTAEFLPRYYNFIVIQQGLLICYLRLQWFRCTLNQRGVAAAPVDNTQARSAPVGPGSCYVQ